MDRVEWTLVVPVMAAIIMPVDVFGKLLFKHDTALMDAFLKTRPIDNKSWNRFILVSNFFSFWNLCWALPLGIAGFFVMPHLQALLSATLFLMVSMVNGLTVTALRKAQGWSPKLPLIGAWLVWLFVAWGYALNPMGWVWLVHLTIFIVLCIASLTGLMGYMGALRSYNEQKTHNGDVSGKNASLALRTRIPSASCAQRDCGSMPSCRWDLSFRPIFMHRIIPHPTTNWRIVS